MKMTWEISTLECDNDTNIIYTYVSWIEGLRDQTVPKDGLKRSYTKMYQKKP
jgi:hypothetical protein